MKVKSENLKVKSFEIFGKKFVALFVLSIVVLFSVLSLVVSVESANAATGINRQINFQGKLVDNNGLNVADSTYSVVFSLYSVSSGGSNVWTETDSVTTKAGIFQVALGANTPLPDNVYFNQDNLYLGIKVGSDLEMAPRIRFTAVPYALNAASLNGTTATQSATGFTLSGGTSSPTNVSFTTAAGALTLQPGVAEGLTIDTNGANGLSLGTSANAISFGGGNNPTYTFNGNGLTTLGGGLTINGTSEIIGNGADATIQTKSNSNSGLTLLSQGSGNITLGQNAGNGNVVITPNAGGQAGLIINDQGSGDLFTASSAGATKFVVNNNGSITLVNGETIDNTTDGTIVLGSNATNGDGAVRVPVKTTTGDPAGIGSVGDIYYNSADSVFRCYQGSGWQNCITAVNFQSTNASNTITLTASEQSLLSGSITPSSTTGKIWINFTGTVNGDSNSAHTVTIRIRRGACTSGTQVGVDQTVTTHSSGDTYTAAVNYVDTPGVTTSTTYNVCAITSAGSPTITGRGATFYEPTGSAATSGLGSLTVQRTDGSGSVVTGVSNLEFGPNPTSSDQFTITDLTGGVAQVTLGNQVGMLNQNESATGVWNFSNGLGIGTGSPQGALDVRGNTATTPMASLSGSTTFAGLVIDNSGTGDLLTASQGGVPHFTVQHNGTIVDSSYTTNGGLLYSTSGGVFSQLADVANGSCLTSAGATSAPTWTPCSGIGTNYLQLNAGAISPFSSTADFLVGGTATTSAKFGFLNVANGTPTASISAGLAGGVYLNATGTLSTTNRQTLSIGNSVSGNIVIDPNGTSPVIIGQNSNPSSELDVRGTSATRPVSSVSGQTTNAALIVDNSGLGDIFTASRSGLARFSITAAGGIKLSNNEGSANQCLTSNGPGAAVTWGICGGGGSSQWQINGPVIAQGNTTEDLVLGGVSTASAKFAFIGNAGTAAPVASISAQNSSGTGLVLSPGTIQSLNNGTLTIGGATTGNILLNALNGAAGGLVEFFNANNTINNAGNLTLAGNINLPNNNTLIGQSGFAQFSSGISVGGGTTLNISNTGAATLLSGSFSGTGNALTLSGAGADINFSGAGTAQILTANNQNLTLNPGGNGSVGINAATNLSAAFDVRGNTATTPTASVSGATSFANLVVDQSGLGDIFTASKSGATKFTIANNGLVTLDSNNYPSCFLTTDANGIITCSTGSGGDTQSANFVDNTANNGVSFTVATNVWDGTNPNITPTSVASNILVSVVVNGTTSSAADQAPRMKVVRTTDGSTPVCTSTQVGIDFSGTYETNSGVAWGASASFLDSPGITTKVKYGVCTAASGLSSANVASITFGVAEFGGNSGIANNYWGLNSGAISLLDTTQDLLIGGSATASAKFGFINVNSGTPTASLSAGVTGGVYMTAAGTIQSTNNQTLTLGGTTTGNIILNPTGSNFVGVGTQAPTAMFDVAGAASVGGQLTFHSGTATIQSSANQSLTLGGNTTGNVLINPTATNFLGIGTSSPLATLDIRDSIGPGGGTSAVASVSGKTSFASLVVNNTGSGDLFTASNAGLTRFTIMNNGNVNIGTDSATLAKYKLTVSDYQRATASAMIENTARNGQAFNNCSGSNQSGCHTGLIIKMGQLGDATVANTGDVYEEFLNGAGRRMGAIRGNNAGAVVFDTLGADYAEYFAVDPSVLPANFTADDVAQVFPTGTLVCQDANGVIPCSMANDSHILGVISEHPGFMGGEDGTNKVLVGLLGQLPVKVSNQNGVIKNGDSLAASSTPGVAVKATQAGAIVGRALVDFTDPDASGTGEIQAFINEGWYDPMVPTDGNYDLLKNADLSVFDQSATSGILDTAYTIKDGAGVAVTATTAFAKATIANIQAGAVVAKEMTTDQLNVTTDNITLGGQTIHDYIANVVREVLSQKNQPAVAVSVNGLITATQSAQLVQTMLSQNDLSATVSGMTITGVLGADSINTKHIAGLTDLSAGTISAASISAQTITAETIKANHIEGLEIITTGLQKDDERITALENMVSSQSATVAPTGIIASPTAGLAVLNSDTIQTTPSGGLRVKGNALVEGILHVVDTLFANNFIVNGVSDFFGNVIFHSGVKFENTPTFNSDTAGIAIIKKGTDHIDVKFSKAYDDTPVVNASVTLVSLTPTPSETPDQMKKRQNDLEQTLLADNIRFVVTNRTNNGFTILLEKPAGEDIAFSWLAIAVQNPAIFQSDRPIPLSPSPTDAISPSPIDSIIPKAATTSAGF